MARDYILPHLPVALPAQSIPDIGDVSVLKDTWQKALGDLTEAHFLEDAVWRDHFALTGTMRTFYGAKSIHAAWKNRTDALHLHNVTVQGTPRFGSPHGSFWVDVQFAFDVSGPPKLSGSGSVSLVPDEQGGWKIWCMRTMLEHLFGQPDVDRAPETPRKSELSNGTNGSDPSGTGYFDCIVLGAGQAGLAVGGRLQSLSVSYVILDKHPNVGDCWASRYDSVKLHTIRDYSHLPYERTFGEEYDEWLTKDDLAEGYKRWATKFGINVWTSTSMVSGSWDDDEKRWTITVSRLGEQKTLKCSFFVLAAGIGCEVPYMPEYPNKEQFKGEILHSSQYRNSKAWAGKHGIVIGSANTGNDVAEDMEAAGLASVTMIQRSPTQVVSTDDFAVLQKGLYNGKMSIDIADRLQFLSPAAQGRLLVNSFMKVMASKVPERYQDLERAGFQMDKESDLHQALLVRSGGHYMDVGACAKIANGQIKVKSGVTPSHYTPDGLMFSDGELLKADAIVFATGFSGNMQTYCIQLFGKALAKQIGEVWGLDDEGELRGVYKPSGHPALWFSGGGLGQTRFYSRFIAMQIKAKLMGTPLPLYLDTPYKITYKP